MNKTKQTAVEWLENQLKLRANDWIEVSLAIEQAKKMEKEQIINAVDGFPLFSRDLNGIDYYEKIYGGKQ